MIRHLSRYLWTAMKDGSRKPAEATRWIKAWGGVGGWPLARTTDDSMQNSSDNRRSRTTASSRAMVRWRARMRDLRLRIWQSPILLFGVLGVPGGDYLDDGQDSPFAVGEVRIFNTPDISGHSAPVSDSVSDSGDDGLPGRWDRWGLARFLSLSNLLPQWHG